MKRHQHRYELNRSVNSEDLRTIWYIFVCTLCTDVTATKVVLE